MSDSNSREVTEAFQEILNYRFRDLRLLEEALTHKSFSNEQPENIPHNERLEFLGDAALDLVVSHFIFESFPAMPEGEMSRIRSEVVSERGLALVARHLGLGKFLWLGRGEERSGGREKDSLLANALEAVLGAVFCDGGFESVRRIALSRYEEPIRHAAESKEGIDYKTRLQELLQATSGRLPVYQLVRAEGPDHDRRYFVEVRFGDAVIGAGAGRSKKTAEQEAARQALLDFRG